MYGPLMLESESRRVMGIRNGIEAKVYGMMSIIHGLTHLFKGITFERRIPVLLLGVGFWGFM